MNGDCLIEFQDEVSGNVSSRSYLKEWSLSGLKKIIVLASRHQLINQIRSITITQMQVNNTIKENPWYNMQIQRIEKRATRALGRKVPFELVLHDLTKLPHFARLLLPSLRPLQQVAPTTHPPAKRDCLLMNYELDELIRHLNCRYNRWVEVNRHLNRRLPIIYFRKQGHLLTKPRTLSQSSKQFWAFKTAFLSSGNHLSIITFSWSAANFRQKFTVLQESWNFINSNQRNHSRQFFG